MRTLLSGLLLFALGLSTGCGRDSSTPADQKIRVAATPYPLAELARQIGGDRVQVYWIAESGQPPTSAQPSDQQLGQFRLADVFISTGPDDPWANRGFGQPYSHLRVVRLDLLPSSRDGPPAGLLWLDPIVVMDLCRELCDRLILVQPDNEKLFRQRAQDYAARIEALVREYQPKLILARRRKLLVLNTDFDPLLLRFGLEPVLAVHTQPTRITEAELATLKQAARLANSRLLVLSADTPQAVMQDLAVRGGFQIVSIDCLGTSAAGGRNTYLDLLKWNLDQLTAATAF